MWDSSDLEICNRIKGVVSPIFYSHQLRLQIADPLPQDAYRLGLPANGTLRELRIGWWHGEQGPDPWSTTTTLTRAVRFLPVWWYSYHAPVSVGPSLWLQNRAEDGDGYNIEQRMLCAYYNVTTQTGMQQYAHMRHRIRLLWRHGTHWVKQAYRQQRMLGPESAHPLLVRDEATTRVRAKKQLAHDIRRAHEGKEKASAVVIG